MPVLAYLPNLNCINRFEKKLTNVSSSFRLCLRLVFGRLAIDFIFKKSMRVQVYCRATGRRSSHPTPWSSLGLSKPFSER